MKPQHFPFGKAVTVFWVDSAIMQGWRKYDEGDSIPIQSIGYVTKTDDDIIVLTTSITNDFAINTPIAIPWGCVVQVRELPEDYDRHLKL